MPAYGYGVRVMFVAAAKAPTKKIHTHIGLQVSSLARATLERQDKPRLRILLDSAQHQSTANLHRFLLTGYG